MPQLPMIIPLIVIGGLIGSLLKSKKHKIPMKRILSWSLIAGLLNAVFAYAELTLTPPPTTTFRSAAFLAQVSPEVFSVGSFLAGFLIVLAVFGVAAAYLRLRGGGISEAEEPISETEEPHLMADSD